MSWREAGAKEKVSELVRREPNAGVVARASGVKGVAISVITVEEVACCLAA